MGNTHDTDDEDEELPQVVEVPIDGTLDLHTYSPKDLKELLPAYFEACQQRGIYEVRVVHGKGTGALRKSVHALLPRLTAVESFHAADERAGSWGATIVRLRRV